MNDRFMFRLPFYNNKGEFSHFQYFDIVGGIEPYNAGVMFHHDEYEQCTGLKDKNGNLIYEGDIIQCYGTRFEVYYDELKCGLLLKCLESNGNKTDIPFYQIDHIYTFEDLMGFENWEQFLNRVNLEVIGNIHEQAEQKE